MEMVQHFLWLVSLLTVAGFGGAAAAAATELQSPVADLSVTTDYHSADISWRHSGSGRPFGFSVGYCELQAWGANRCKSKIVQWRPEQKDGSTPYRVTIGGLRMDTEYEFTVTPLDRRMHKEREQSRQMEARTKAFSATTRCLGGASEVTVHTGPHFAGRLSVEDDPREECGVQGDPDSDRQEYVLRIDHGTCRTQRSNSEVRTFVMVQEQDTIQTHSTRRFLVICNYESESFTVSAGVNLPRVGHHSAVGSHVQEVSLDPEPELASRDPPRLLEVTSREGRQLIVAADGPPAAASRVAPLRERNGTGGGWAQLVLLMVVVAAVVFGVAIGAIFSRRAALRRRHSSAHSSGEPSSDTSSSSSSSTSSSSSSSSSDDRRAARLPLELRRDGARSTHGRLTMPGGDYPSVTC
ncbi:uncharacterized protein LOC122377800 [Amphibalanus amphitrite]|uniref:uncharacterized protein LOC122377800 n=1 Tax=Amphibalanus amphitrite TaxID=1232801 RepID=UPI001C90DFDE|nr:uncharacterized protein LOC122377800 [Amphibalanus amphitrite]